MVFSGITSTRAAASCTWPAAKITRTAHVSWGTSRRQALPMLLGSVHGLSLVHLAGR